MGIKDRVKRASKIFINEDKDEPVVKDVEDKSETVAEPAEDKVEEAKKEVESTSNKVEKAVKKNKFFKKFINKFKKPEANKA
ncbi:hypothetical protein CANTEDRAFT_135980 [Yamadazyma tenuis ATCC 10573]|uniref:Uncharacterized protein n=1 Tax=Candida tenuis (strain ATCC 10573 / BCRC 21748 / CBS 615 / JCM 9827 / NBRC 10315 / NRRL Y-1498 / VKM Y-70) TaxID=590646 RepID=G3BAF6_CANTC|nr:uncharacterized protein CANTEDRAFT_135980 [Yamadazyma tenuis ATCC 10573]EGV62047.1 hypothetical protein CANTEDRAFT_135980 [Yamadazyma tenuis ATCC 10573]